MVLKYIFSDFLTSRKDTFLVKHFQEKFSEGRINEFKRWKLIKSQIWNPVEIKRSMVFIFWLPITETNVWSVTIFDILYHIFIMLKVLKYSVTHFISISIWQKESNYSYWSVLSFVLLYCSSLCTQWSTWSQVRHYKINKHLL